MTLRDLARRSRRYFWRSHLGLLAGTAVAAAVLVGALVVGDSVRGTLQARVRERLGFGIATAMDIRDRFVTTNLADGMRARFPAIGSRALKVGDVLSPFWSPAGELVLPATATRQDGTSRANRVRLHGVTPGFITTLSFRLGSNAPAGNNVWLGEPLARQLQVGIGDSLVFRIHRPGALSREAILSPRDDQSVGLRVRIDRILSSAEGGAFGLHTGSGSPMNAFIAYDTLAVAAGLPGRVNLLLGGPLSRMEAPRISDRWKHKTSELRSGGFGSFWNSDLINLSRPLDPESVNREMTRILEETWSLEDAEASLRLGTNRSQVSTPQFLELTSRRIFIDPPIATAAIAVSTNSVASPTPVLTYLVNSISSGDRMVPYSMVTAAGPPYTPQDLKDDEILVNRWLADDLNLHPGDTVQLAYYRADSGTTLVENTNQFRVRAVIPMEGVHADRSLMPEFPGLAKAESTRDWDAGFDLVHKIRDRDEAYWKQWRGTPKAFINVEAGRRIWGNRFGDFTAIRWFLPASTDAATAQRQIAQEIRSHLKPDDLGMVWQPVAEIARQGASSGQDFGGLFIGFSFFLIVAALLLTSMLFQFALDLRLQETGVLLALGWPPRRVRLVLFREGFGVAVLGTAAGTLLGVAYARGILWGLNTLWREAVAGESLLLFVRIGTLATGALLGLLVAAATLWFSLRNRVAQPARLLLSGTEALDGLETRGDGSSWPRRGAFLAGIIALGASIGGLVSNSGQQPALFFIAGSSCLVGGILAVRLWIRSSRHARTAPSLSSIALRSIRRRPGRSLATILLLACATFLIVAVAANRLDAGKDATVRSSGTGGFALWGESSLPVTQDLNSRRGREFYGLDASALTNVSVVPLRVRDGDDASCLNLNRAQRPRLLGVAPASLADRHAFTFTGMESGIARTNGWNVLLQKPSRGPDGIEEIVAVGDANSIQWALGKHLGDRLEYTDERGRPFRIRLVGAVANSILQGNLVIADQDFIRLFPSEAGYRAYLVDAPPDSLGAVSTQMTRALSDVGLELTSMRDRLDRFNAVQNTYLNTFQVLGGLGLLLGSVGLGVLVLRNVQDRRGELALMQALGFEASAIRTVILREHLVLLLLGLGLGGLSAGIAVIPALLTPGSGIPWSSLVVTLLIVTANGAAWAWVATRRALAAPLLPALRDV